MTDFRPPIPPDHLYSYQYTTDEKISSDNVTSKSHQSIIEGNPFLLKTLSNIYISNSQLRLSTEASFTSFILFHRFLSHYLHQYEKINVTNDDPMDHHSTPEVVSSRTLSLNQEERKQLGNVAAASIFLACKLNNEQRRIRDIINMRHIFQFDSDYMGSYNNPHPDLKQAVPDNSVDSEYQHKQTIILPQPLPPPKLDEDYWKRKEEMVRTEQMLLRVIKFDVNMSYPHRVMVVVWEELVKVTNTYLETDHSDSQQQKQSHEVNKNLVNGDTPHTSSINKKNLKEIDWIARWREILKDAWKRINDSVFHVDALSCGATDLACAAISLALSNNRNVIKEIQTDVLLQCSCFSAWWEWVGVNETSMKVAQVRLMEASKVLSRLNTKRSLRK